MHRRYNMSYQLTQAGKNATRRIQQALTPEDAIVCKMYEYIEPMPIEDIAGELRASPEITQRIVNRLCGGEHPLVEEV